MLMGRTAVEERMAAEEEAGLEAEKEDVWEYMGVERRVEENEEVEGLAEVVAVEGMEPDSVVARD